MVFNAGGLALFDARHASVFALSDRFPVMVMEALSISAILVMFIDPRYQLMVGAGTAFLLTTHRTNLWVPSVTVMGSSLGIKDTLYTSTLMMKNKIIKTLYYLHLRLPLL